MEFNASFYLLNGCYNIDLKIEEFHDEGFNGIKSIMKDKLSSLKN